MKIIEEIKQGRYINMIVEAEDGTYYIQHCEKDMMYGDNGVCCSMPYSKLTLEQAKDKLKEITQ